LEFLEISKWIKKNKPSSVCIETAHIYMDEAPNKQHELAAQIGSGIVKTVERERCLSTKHLFIDNYNPDPKNFILDIDKYIEMLSEFGFRPNIITFETSLEIPAKNLLIELKEETVHREHNVYLNSRQILLMAHNRPTCSLLDTALYIAKLSMFELVITILPKSFREQQKKFGKY